MNWNEQVLLYLQGWNTGLNGISAMPDGSWNDKVIALLKKIAERY